MPVRLSEEEVVTIGVLADKGKNHCEIARTLGVSEGTVRYHLRRQAEGAQDGRRQKGFQAEALAGIIGAWMQGHPGTGRSRSSERFGEWRRRLGPRARWIGPSIRRWPLETSWSPFRRSSWCSPTAGSPPLCGVGGETSCPGCSATTRVIADCREWPPSTGSTTSRRPSPREAAPGERSIRSTGPMPDRWAFTLMPADRGKPKRKGRWRPKSDFRVCWWSRRANTGRPRGVAALHRWTGLALVPSSGVSGHRPHCRGELASGAGASGALADPSRTLRCGGHAASPSGLHGSLRRSLLSGSLSMGRPPGGGAGLLGQGSDLSRGKGPAGV